MTEEDILKDSDWRMRDLSVGKKLSTWDSWRQEVGRADGKLIKQKRGRLSSLLKNDESWDHTSELAKVDRQDKEKYPACVLDSELAPNCWMKDRKNHFVRIVASTMSTCKKANSEMQSAVVISQRHEGSGETLPVRQRPLPVLSAARVGCLLTIR